MSFPNLSLIASIASIDALDCSGRASGKSGPLQLSRTVQVKQDVIERKARAIANVCSFSAPRLSNVRFFKFLPVGGMTDVRAHSCRRSPAELTAAHTFFLL